MLRRCFSSSGLPCSFCPLLQGHTSIQAIRPVHRLKALGNLHSATEHPSHTDLVASIGTSASTLTLLHISEPPHPLPPSTTMLLLEVVEHYIIIHRMVLQLYDSFLHFAQY